MPAAAIEDPLARRRARARRLRGLYAVTPDLADTADLVARVAAALAGAVLALTPVAVLMFRFNNPDALLTLLMALGAWATLHAVDRGSVRWMAVAGAFVGLGFLTKSLQVFLVLPALRRPLRSNDPTGGGGA